MSYWYVLFVLTGHERQVENRIMNQLYDEVIVPFIPMLETLFKRAGKVKREINIMFPGYVFIETDLESVEFLQRILHLVSTSKDIVGILRYGNSDEIAVREDERASFLRLCNAITVLRPQWDLWKEIDFTLKVVLWLGWKAI